MYVDGFNLYHAIADLGQPHLKWLDLKRLAGLLSRGHTEPVERIVICTAYFPGDHGKRKRHEAYLAAMAMRGVSVRMGHTTTEPTSCKSCGHCWDAPREKETDINLALAMYADAVSDLYDTAFLITADTDQAATIKAIRSDFPGKRLIVVTPPGRMPSKHLAHLAHAKMTLTDRQLDDCVLPERCEAPGFKTVYRPDDYAPPPNWVHPDDRPSRKHR